MELKNKVINFLGDSITYGVGTSGTEARFSSLIEKSVYSRIGVCYKT